MKHITDPKELYSLLYDECRRNDSDMRMSYFGLPVRMRKGSIIAVFRKLMKEFNGTFVGHLTNYRFSRLSDACGSAYTISGYDDTFRSMRGNPYYDEVFMGDGSSFLESFFKGPESKDWYGVLTDNEKYLKGKPVTGLELRAIP